MTPGDVRVVALEAGLGKPWAALFEAEHAPCYCRYWHFGGSKNEWLDRCAHRPEENRDEHLAAVAAGDPAARGLVALAGDGPEARAVGWMKLVPRVTVPKLRALPVYKNLPLGDGNGVYSVGCFLVHAEHRRAGVARALVMAAPTFVRAWGGHTLEAYPRRTADALHDAQAWQGHEEMFRAAGFTAFHDEAPYPVYRRAV